MRGIYVRLRVISILGFAVLIFAARVVGGTQPLPEAVRMLHLDACALPCWNGITPGQTLINAVYPRIVSQFDVVSLRFFDG